MCLNRQGRHIGVAWPGAACLMAALTVQIGQCGNQLGLSLFDSLHAHRPQDPVDPLSIPTGCNPFFRQSQDDEEVAIARAVLVDTEPKVLDVCKRRVRPWRYEQRHVVRAGQGGAGNNWAHGYGPVARRSGGAVMNAVRKEAERADSVSAFMVLHSVAGGTGSGLGTAITERLQDEYPRTDRLNVVVSPYHTGEVIVQNYNAMLTLGHLSSASDAVLFLENEHVNRICTKLLNVVRPTLGDLNTVLSSHIASFIVPASSAPTMCLRSSIQALCGQPAFNFLTMRLAPQTPTQSIDFNIESWHGIVRRLMQLHLSGVYADCDINWSVKLPMHRSIAKMLTLRGLNCHQAAVDAFYDPGLYAAWSLDPFTVRRCPITFDRHEKFASLISNSQAVLVPFGRMVTKAKGMFECQAFVHQYTAYGTEPDDFERAFLSVDQVIKNYQAV